MTTVVVSIGRNVGDVPLSDEHWLAFQDEVRHALSMGTLYVDAAHSRGEWLGVAEDSATFVADDFTPYSVGLVSDALAVIGGRYGQDAVAVTTGETTLVNSRHVYDYETSEVR